MQITVTTEALISNHCVLSAQQTCKYSNKDFQSKEITEINCNNMKLLLVCHKETNKQHSAIFGSLEVEVQLVLEPVVSK